MYSRTPSRTRRWVLGAGLLAGIVALTSCGPDYKARGVVKGKVTTGKRPLGSGTVTFYGPNNIVSMAAIDENGNYTMSDAPVGEVTITVVVPAPPPGMGAKAMKEGWKKIAGSESKDPTGEGPGIANMSKMPTNIVRIDEKFSKPETSGLKLTVEKGEQTHNIEL